MRITNTGEQSDARIFRPNRKESKIRSWTEFENKNKRMNNLDLFQIMKELNYDTTKTRNLKSTVSRRR